MASKKPPDADSSPPPYPGRGNVDSILRNALRYTISQKEYETLQRYLLTRSPPTIRRKAPPPQKYQALVQKGDDFNAATIRASLRVFIISQTGLKLWDLISTRLLARSKPASLAGFALSVYPADQLRITIAIYFATRSLEFLYNALEGDGWFKDRPSWWGTWLLMPLATGQLLHAFVFDRDCFPKAYGDFILHHTPNYVQRRPASYPSKLPWPSANTVVDSLAEMSRLNWPAFVSPILFPTAPQTLPTTLTQLSPITSPAHPSHTSLSCATLHPSDPSCTRTLANYVLAAFPALAKFFAAFYALFSIPKYKKFLADPMFGLSLLVKRVLKTTAFMTGAIGTSWGSICLFQYMFPRTFLPQGRWFLGGAMGGMWAFVDWKGGGGQVMYSVRMSLDSLWKVGKKRGWWKGVQGGDIAVFVASLVLMNVLYERRRGAVDSGVGKALGWLRGEQLFASRMGEKDGSEK
ncbi:MAG: hypothetical protein Q9217_005819 [Psora testacea]